MDPDPTKLESSVRTAETRDLGIVATASVGSTLPGGVTSVPFSLQYAGQPHPLADFALTATTGLPGGTATAQVASIKPLANSGTAILVSVSVPAGAAPGTYPVTLTATSANGMTRTGTGSVIVLAPPPPVDPGQPVDPTLPPPPTPDTRRPLARVTLPACRARMTRVRCAALRTRPASWRVLRGTAADAAPSSGLSSAQVNVVRRRGKACAAFAGGRFRAMTCAKATTVWTIVGLRRGAWSLTLGTLGHGRYVARARAVDAAGNVQLGFPTGSTRRFTLPAG
jgi:hypothetical protein